MIAYCIFKKLITDNKNIFSNHTFLSSKNMIEKIAEGKMKRFYKDNTLVNQSFIKDSKISVSQYLSNYSSNIYITSFGRVSIG